MSSHQPAALRRAEISRFSVRMSAWGPQRHRRGWVSREPILGRHTGIITVDGLFRPITLVQGRAVTTWSLPDGVVRLDRLVELPAAAEEALAADAADVRRFSD